MIYIPTTSKTELVLGMCVQEEDSATSHGFDIYFPSE